MDGPKHMYSDFVVQYNALFCIKNRGTRRRRRKGQEDAFSGLPNTDFYNHTQLIGLRQGSVGLEFIIHTTDPTFLVSLFWLGLMGGYWIVLKIFSIGSIH